MPKLRYEIDPHNRLIVTGAGRKSGLPKFRRVLDGRFKVDKDNILSCHIKAPQFEEESHPQPCKKIG